MFQGDLVIIGSDGVFDNLFKDEAFLENELRGMASDSISHQVSTMF